MKVLQINSVCGIRSTGRIAVEIAEKFMSEGHQCRIAYGRETVPEKYKEISYRIGTEQDVRRNALKARLFDSDGFEAKKETGRFLKWAEAYDPDLLWIHNLHGYYINVEMLFAWIKSRPLMEVRWTLHDCWAFTGHCSYFSFVNCEQWKTHCKSCCQTCSYPKSIWMDRCESNFRKKRDAFCGVKNLTLVTPSNWLRNLVEQSFLREYPTEVHYNTIDKTVFYPRSSDFRQKYNLQERKIILGVASTWEKRKGLSDFIELSNLLDERFQIVLVGLTKKQIPKIPQNIICIERTNSKEELAEIYSAADLFLNLTYEDNYPTVNLESQACGTPCFTYNTGGSVESVPKENVVEPNVNAMCHAVQNYFDK